MKRSTELFILLSSVFKWLILGSGVGVVVGSSTALFLVIIQTTLTLTDYLPYATALLPLGLMLSWWLTTTIAPDAPGHGTERVVPAIHQREGLIHARVIPTKLLATIITISTGGSAGNIGPCAQIGGGLCSVLSVLFRLDDIDRKRLVICGISAGFASVLGTPIAGAVFAAEVLFIGRLYYGVLLPSLTSAIVGSQVASSWGIEHFHLIPPTVPPISLSLFLITGLAGIVFGLGALLCIEILNRGKDVATLVRPYGIMVGLLGGLGLVGLGITFSHDFLGLGWNTVSQNLQGEPGVWYAFLLKSVTTSITLNFGGSGGIILPICFVESSLGVTFAEWMHVDLAMFAALGFVSLVAGATNTPITGIILAMELFGPGLAPYAAITSTMSYVITGHHSAIPTQILPDSKSPSITIDSGKEIERATLTPAPRFTAIRQKLKNMFKASHQPPE